MKSLHNLIANILLVKLLGRRRDGTIDSVKVDQHQGTLYTLYTLLH